MADVREAIVEEVGRNEGLTDFTLVCMVPRQRYSAVDEVSTTLSRAGLVPTGTLVVEAGKPAAGDATAADLAVLRARAREVAEAESALAAEATAAVQVEPVSDLVDEVCL